MSQESCPAREDLARLLRGELCEKEALSLERHFASCSSCGRLAAALEAEEAHWPALPGDWPRDEAVDRLMSRLEALAPSLSHGNTGNGAAGVTPLQATTPSPGIGRKGSELPPIVPGYEILEELGRGGMGVVYRARQVQLNRIVALKMILAGEHAGADHLARFQAEALAAARLRHPNIVQIYEVGAAHGRPYLAMEFCPDGSLAERLRQGPLPPPRAAELLRQIALAVHAAHLEQVVHRDLKPANILLASPPAGVGEAVEGWQPKVSDFGLAKLLDVGDGQTRSGELLGTPSYMAPEQAEGKLHQIGPAADVYALGAVLYELLTGRPPFKGTSIRETLELVCTADPAPPRQLQPHVPGDLETICLKCLHKDPRKRYASAAELAADCAAFLAGEPIRARPVGRLEKVVKWVRRRPALAALYAVVVLASSGLLGLAFWFSATMAGARGALEAEEARSEAQARLAQTHEFFGLLHQVQRRSARPESGWTWANLADLEKAGRMDLADDHLLELRAEAVAALGVVDIRLSRAETPLALGQPFDVQSLAYHPKGRWLALGQWRASGFALCHVALIDPQGKEKPRLLSFPSAFLASVVKGFQEGVSRLAFSPDGRWLVAGTSLGTLHCWDLDSKRPRRVSRAAHKDRMDALVFSRDGAALFSTGRDKIVKRWSFPELKATAEAATKHPVVGLAVHPTEGWLLCAADPSTEYLSADTLRPLGTAVGVCPRACFSPDGRCVLSHYRDSVELINVCSGEVIRKLRGPGEERSHDRNVCALAFSPDGALILSASEGKQVRLWETASGRLLADLSTDGENPQAVFHPDGRSLAVTAGKQVRFYEMGGLREQTFLAGRPYPLTACAVHPDGRRLACLARHNSSLSFGEVSVWPLTSSPSAAPAAVHTLTTDDEQFRHSLALDPAGQTIVLGQPGAFTFWSPSGARTLPSGGPGVNALSFAPDGRLWSAVGGEVQGRDLPEGKVAARWSSEIVRRFTGASDPVCASAGRRWVTAGGNNGRLYLLRCPNAAEQAVIHVADAPVRSVALSADESLVAAGSDRGELRLLRLPGGAATALATAHRDRVVALAFAGAKLLASGSRDRTVKLWDCDGGALRELATLPTPGPVRWLAFHPDGVRLFVLLEGERAVRVWRLDRVWTRLNELGLGAGLEAMEAKPLPAAAPTPPPTPPVAEPPAGPNGLRTELFADVDLHHCVKTRYDRQISVASPAPAFDPLLPKDYFSVRWTGWLKAPRPGRYTLRLECAGPGRLWLDGRRCIDGRQKKPFHQEVEVELTDRPHGVRVEYVHWTGGAGICLSWTQAGGFAQAPIPPRALYHDRTDAERTALPPSR